MWWLGRVIEIGVCLAVIALLMTYSTPTPQGILATLGRVTADYAFDYVTWEVEALASKLDAELFGVQAYLDEETRAEVVRRYLGLIGEIQSLEYQVGLVYADPDEADPEAASADLRAERDALREEQERWQELAEAIIEGQIAAVLREEGLATFGQILPPVALHFTQTPVVMVISPRDRIETTYTQALVPGLTVGHKEELEAAVDAELDMASLIVPIGGMALYPSMVLETGWYYSAFETSAHEWGHHWFFFSPNGASYFSSRPEGIRINETTVSILGYDVAHKVIERYYPDWAADLPALPWEEEPEPEAEAVEDKPSAFDYVAEMHETRVTVDELLAAGKIEEAEAYMEERRRLFVENGYNIRKLNQAYFAFYGGYQATPGGPAGEDPVGPAIREIRRLAPSLKAFASRMVGVSSMEALEAALEQARAEWGD
jgi:hypothetical protein